MLVFTLVINYLNKGILCVCLCVSSSVTPTTPLSPSLTYKANLEWKTLTHLGKKNQNKTSKTDGQTEIP